MLTRNDAKVFLDGNAWCALIGDNIQEGTCGFGETPEESLKDLDKQLE